MRGRCPRLGYGQCALLWCFFHIIQGRRRLCQIRPSILRHAHTWRTALWCYLGSFPNRALRNITHGTLRGYDGPDLFRLYIRLTPGALDDPTTDSQLQRDIVAELCSSCPYSHALPHRSALSTRLKVPLWTRVSSGNSTNFQYASPRGNLWFTPRPGCKKRMSPYTSCTCAYC